MAKGIRNAGITYQRYECLGTLYADHAVFLVETSHYLQQLLNRLCNATRSMDLKNNVSKNE